MGFLVIFIQRAIGQGIGILYGALGEILTEKSGNLNLGIPGMMYMGGIAGLIGAFLYENSTETPNGFVGLLISFVCAFICAALGGLVYSVLTISLRANQNVTGLALTPSVWASETFSGDLWQSSRAVWDRSLLRLRERLTARPYRGFPTWEWWEISCFPTVFSRTWLSFWPSPWPSSWRGREKV